MKYKVLKEVRFENGDYNPGDILETSLGVKGLILRGILKVYEEPCIPCPETACPPKDCLTDKLAKSKDYNSADFELTEEDLDLPKVNLQGLEKYIPQAQLKQAQEESDAKVSSAQRVVKKTTRRSAKQVEMPVAMTNLADDANAVKKATRKKRGG